MVNARPTKLPSTRLCRYVAFLRGVSPMNAKMPALKKAFEAAGFREVTTVLSSGNVVFNARVASDLAIEKKAEGAMKEGLGRSFFTIVRSRDELRELLDSDPWERFGVAPEAKRVVSFFRKPPRPAPTLPIERDGARILALRGRELFTAYVPGPSGPVFMAMIEKMFGDEITTRTWGTVRKVARLPGEG
jgi:uncharacterized protein (DUF1697 family)